MHGSLLLRFLKEALNTQEAMSMMGRVNGEAVFCISVTNDYGNNDDNVTDIIGRQIICSVLSSRKVMTTTTYTTFENEGDLENMFTEIEGEIKDVFYNRNE